MVELVIPHAAPVSEMYQRQRECVDVNSEPQEHRDKFSRKGAIVRPGDVPRALSERQEVVAFQSAGAKNGCLVLTLKKNKDCRVVIVLVTVI